MSHFPKVLPWKDFLFLLVVLLCIGGALLALFTFVATMEVDEIMGVSLFLIAAGLLIGAYMVGLMVLVVVGLTAISGRSGKLNDQSHVKQSA